MMKGILVVGAGLAGATCARELAEANCPLEVTERRRRRACRPHLFHTNSERVMTWLRRFADFVPYLRPTRGAGAPKTSKG